MGQAINIVEQIMDDRNNYEQYGLRFQQYKRKWELFNMLVGKNGSGKSRVLQMIKDKAKGDCAVIHLDFAKNMLVSGNTEERVSGTEEKAANTEEVTDTEEKELIDMLVFRDIDRHEMFLDFLKHLDNQMLSVFNELLHMSKNENKHIRKRVEAILKELRPSIKDILHREIKEKADGIYLCNEGREVTVESEWELLSPGERSILIVIFVVLFIKLFKEPCILLIDEMETHLHPEAQVKLYRLVRQALEDSGEDHCTCIASHSIFLLPLFQIHELVYMNHGGIEKINGGLYQQIYDNLTGEGEKKEESLTDFLYSMSAWQYADYLAQCFLAPTTVDEAKGNDEQALKFFEVLKTMYQRKDAVEVLDFGAGSARIGRCMELMAEKSSETAEMLLRLKYHIYDKYCISDGFRKNTSWRGEAYSSEKDLAASGIKFDVILLYNVLHEVSVDEWDKELRFMLELLDNNGILLFGERQILSVGEKPYGKSGYLVLGKEELLKLFSKSKIEEILLPQKLQNVSTCYTITKPETRDGYPDVKNVKAALYTLKDSTREKIRNREKNGLGERGSSRKYAFYCQQYVNVEEAIEIVEEEERKQESRKREYVGGLTERLIAAKRQATTVVERKNNNMTLTDIIQSNFPQGEKWKKIEELAQMETVEGRKAKKYLVTHK